MSVDKKVQPEVAQKVESKKAPQKAQIPIKLKMGLLNYLYKIHGQTNAPKAQVIQIIENFYENTIINFPTED